MSVGGAVKVCKVEGCTYKAKRVIRQMCQTHYNAWTKTVPLEARTIVTRPVLATSCTAVGCTVTGSMVRGLCEKHYTRWRRHGDAAATLIGSKPYRITSGGYVERKEAHPLARRGWVAEHRKVLYNHLDGADRPCTWCGMPLRWEATYQADPDALLVDHVDWDKQNNDPSNLVPSCLICNIQRVDPDVRRSA